MSRLLRDRNFNFCLDLNDQYRQEIEQYCQDVIGKRTFYLSSCYGGKQWAMTGLGKKLQVFVDDSNHAILLKIKYS
jgi:hypothetical protein